VCKVSWSSICKYVGTYINVRFYRGKREASKNVEKHWDFYSHPNWLIYCLFNALSVGQSGRMINE